MMKNKVVFFEISASNFKQAKVFYEQVFDWKVELGGDEGAMGFYGRLRRSGRERHGSLAKHQKAT